MTKKQKTIKAWAIVDGEGKFVTKLPKFIPLGLSVFLIAPKRTKYLTIAKYNEGLSGRKWDRNNPKIVPVEIKILK